MEYLATLNGISSSTVDELSSMQFVARDAWMWHNVQLRVNFRYIRQSCAFWGWLRRGNSLEFALA